MGNKKNVPSTLPTIYFAFFPQIIGKKGRKFFNLDCDMRKSQFYQCNIACVYLVCFFYENVMLNPPFFVEYYTIRIYKNANTDTAHKLLKFLGRWRWLGIKQLVFYIFFLLARLLPLLLFLPYIFIFYFFWNRAFGWFQSGKVTDLAE